MVRTVTPIPEIWGYQWKFLLLRYQRNAMLTIQTLENNGKKCEKFTENFTVHHLNEW